jgi:endonuclease/exonuclease/phosphatase family metal-dependent hydrolase
VWTGGDAARSAVPLLTFGDQHYGLVCVRFTHAGQAVRACSTHLAAGKDPEDEAQRTQLTAEIDRVTRGWKEAVVVGGDFNSRPKATPLDSMYARGASSNGRFLEIHQIRTGEPRRGGLTTMYSTAKGRKSDYIFVVQGHTRLGGGTERVVRDSPSDHHILIGTFPLR